MFSYSKFSKLNWCEKINYLTGLLEISDAQIFQIIDADHLIKEKITIDEVCQSPDGYTEERERLYFLLTLFNFLISFTLDKEVLNPVPPKRQISILDMKRIWETNMSHLYYGFVVKPPWYGEKLSNYLLNHRLTGLIKCIKWTKEY